MNKGLVTDLCVLAAWIAGWLVYVAIGIGA
jgi:hypothetical protein